VRLLFADGRAQGGLMTPTLRPATAEDVPAIDALLSDNRLPTAGFRDDVRECIVATDDGRVVGAAGLEIYDDSALLRSVVVAAAVRGRGLGQQLSRAAVEAARRRGVQRVFLLTTTAERFFPKLGFAEVPRAAVPATVQQSVEFRGACPATAICMRIEFGSTD
jgi:amino-acid N-acetyltransferase